MQFNKLMRRQVYKMVATEDGRGRKSVADGFAAGSIHLEIDVDAIMNTLGDKVLRNKTGRAIAMGGLVKARVFNKRREP